MFGRCSANRTTSILAITNALTWAGTMIAVAVVLKGTPHSEMVKSILLIGWMLSFGLMTAVSLKLRAIAPTSGNEPPVR